MRKNTASLPNAIQRGAIKAICGLSTALTLLAVLQGTAVAAAPAPGVINAIGVENEYADVIAQIGGRYVQVSAIETDPNTDPHTSRSTRRLRRKLRPPT